MAKHGPISLEACACAAAAAAVLTSQSVAAWLCAAGSAARVRAVQAGSSTGLALSLLAYPLAQPLCVPPWVLSCAVMCAAYLLCASTGPAFPDLFKHEDGGTYRGQWR
ncbi:uncharacterized protein HaLaN_31506, partial [Haematococcus lacustris]